MHVDDSDDHDEFPEAMVIPTAPELRHRRLISHNAMSHTTT